MFQVVTYFVHHPFPHGNFPREVIHPHQSSDLRIEPLQGWNLANAPVRRILSICSRWLQRSLLLEATGAPASSALVSRPPRPWILPGLPETPRRFWVSRRAPPQVAAAAAGDRAS